MTTKEIYQIYPSTITSFDGDTRKKVPYTMYLDALENKKVGDEIYSSVGAPGIGHTIEVITKIDETGVYGYLKEDTTRILTESEVY